MKILQIVIAVLLSAYVVYSVYHSIQIIIDFNKVSKHFVKTHPDAKEYSKGFWQSLGFTLLGSVGFVMATQANNFGLDAQSLLVIRVTYIGMGIIFIGFAIETSLKRTIFVGKSNFFCGNEIYKYKSIQKVEDAGTFFKKKDIYLLNGETLRIPAKLGTYIEDEYMEWKKDKKAKKRK